jgi:hypothetical protein
MRFVMEWQNALPEARVCAVRRANRGKLPPRSLDATHLLRSWLLRRSLRKRRSASRKSCESIMMPPAKSRNGLARPN